ncbi:MAG: putative peptidoglycan glycosyltransferase FtsW [Planctomycetota bacterium]
MGGAVDSGIGGDGGWPHAVLTERDVSSVRRAARGLLVVVMLLMAFGLAGVFSAGANITTRPTGTFNQQPLVEQAIHVLLAIAAMLLVARIDPRWIRRQAGWGLVLAALLLVLVLIPGVGEKIGGARRWIRLAPGVGFQPSELAKTLVLIYLAAYLANKGDAIRAFRQGLLAPLLVIGVLAGLILLEPDVGTTALLVAVCVTLLVIAGARPLQLSLLGVAALTPAVLYVRSSLGYVAQRFESFLDPPLSSQVWHSMHAIASGGLFGVGLGAGQHKLQYFAESKNDFVFAVIGEELGFLGVTILITLYVALVLCGLRIILALRDRYALFVATGLLLLMAFGAIMNMAVATATAPAKGIPLPFVSAGGSSLMISAIGVGLVLGLVRAEVEARVAGRCPNPTST